MNEDEGVIAIKHDVETAGSLRILVGSNLGGVVVSIGGGPSAKDPFEQLNFRRHFATIEDALSELDGMARWWLQEQFWQAKEGGNVR